MATPTFNIPEILELFEASKQQLFRVFPELSEVFKSVQFTVNTDNPISSTLQVTVYVSMGNDDCAHTLVQLSALEATSNVFIRLKLQRFLQDIMEQHVEYKSGLNGLNTTTPAETAFKEWLKPIQYHPIPIGMNREEQMRLVFLSGYHAALDNQAELDKITCEMIGG